MLAISMLFKQHPPPPPPINNKFLIEEMILTPFNYLSGGSISNWMEVPLPAIDRSGRVWQMFRQQRYATASESHPNPTKMKLSSELCRPFDLLSNWVYGWVNSAALNSTYHLHLPLSCPLFSTWLLSNSTLPFFFSFLYSTPIPCSSKKYFLNKKTNTNNS